MKQDPLLQLKKAVKNELVHNRSRSGIALAQTESASKNFLAGPKLNCNGRVLRAIIEDVTYSIPAHITVIINRSLPRSKNLRRQNVLRTVQYYPLISLGLSRHRIWTTTAQINLGKLRGQRLQKGVLNKAVRFTF
ncbi:hypothetical protein B0H16DRAFT_1447495 [Mycena metata]|uniref:Uncharacterized protein n=1 Tax=Mycena metata TaxID=1033252 RepID=A0AAD7KAZ0_9AGAR|nr:hypothetical protein B0H16DRAFT_1447495 [Mycena metata]